MSARQFLASLRQEIEQHPALRHPVLAWLESEAAGRNAFSAFGLLHYPLVCRFTSYLERLLIAAPDSRAKLWIAKVLVNEYGEGSEGRDHPSLYRDFLRTAGVIPNLEFQDTQTEPASAFIREHERICRDEPFLVGLGAVGPGHEWSILHMFRPIVSGLRRVGFAAEEIAYFTLHMEQDLDHGAWLEEALACYVTTRAAQDLVRRGALLSLGARSRFWDGVQAKLGNHLGLRGATPIA